MKISQFFNANNTLSKIINLIFDIFALSICWFLCSIPILTMGLSCTGLYYAVDRYVLKGKANSISKGFVYSIKTNIKQGIIVYLVVFVVALLILWSMWISYQVMISGVFMGKVIFGFGIVIFILYIGYLSYLFPTLATYKYTNRELFSVCFKLSIMHLPITLFFAVLIISATIFAYYFWITLFISPAIIAIIQSKILTKIYLKHS